MMGKTRLMISNHSKLAPRTNKAKPSTWGQLKKLTTEEGRIGQRTGTAFDLGYLVLGYVLRGNYVWQYITKKVGRQQ